MRIIIAGAGSVGTHLLERLASEHHDIVLIDLKEELLEKLSSHYDIQTVCGSASSLEVLKRAGLSSADVFIAATNSDETNLISCLLSESINEDTSKIARIKELVTDESGLSDKIASVFDHFINPASEAASLLLRLCEVPGAAEVMDFASGRVWVVGVMVDDESPLVGKKLKELGQVLDMSEMLIVAIARSGQYIIPHGDDAVKNGDEVFVATAANRLSAVYEVLGRTRPPVKSVIIYGGGNIGKTLAASLSKRDVKVKLIEQDTEICERLAGELSKVLVLCGDGTDHELLRDEGVGDVDVFVGASADEENNILSTLLAKRLGVKTGAAIVTKSSYLNLASEIGIDVVVSPNIAAASTILKFVRQQSISSVFSTRDDSAEVLEIVADKKSKIVGKPLQELKLPPGVIVGAVVHNDIVTIPKGDRVISPGERVIFFAQREAIAKLQKMF